MVRSTLLLLIVAVSSSLFAQPTIYEYRDLKVSNSVPIEIASERSAAIIQIPSVQQGYLVEGDWKNFAAHVHKYLYRMGIDVVLYLNQNDFNSGNSTRNFYESVLSDRKIVNLIFVTKLKDGYELLCSSYNGKSSLISNNQQAYYKNSKTLNKLMLDFARDVKRAEVPMQNFLIPEKPTFLDALSIVQNANIKIYPGQVRRSKLAVEKFSKIDIPETASDELRSKIEKFNREIDLQNLQLELLLKDLPYDIEFVDYLSDEDLLRRRYQFVLRNVCASAQSIKAMLKYDLEQSDAGFVSVVPEMPDRTSIKTFSRKAMLYKFYIRQNIAKNVYVGEWDADETWQAALKNYIGNMIQFFNKGN